MGRPTREESQAEHARLAGSVDLEADRGDRLRKLEELAERLQRRGKRQAALFSNGNPVLKLHGRHGHRAPPARVDRELEASLARLLPQLGDADFSQAARLIFALDATATGTTLTVPVNAPPG